MAADPDTADGSGSQQVRDLDGHVGYTLAFFALDAPHAGRLAEALRAAGVGANVFSAGGARDWHIYKYWEHILEQKSATEEGCPFTCPYYDQPLPPYAEDMCPRTLDLLSRGISIHLSEWLTEDDRRQMAEAINQVLDRFQPRIQDASWHDIRPIA